MRREKELRITKIILRFFSGRREPPLLVEIGHMYWENPKQKDIVIQKTIPYTTALACWSI